MATTTSDAATGSIPGHKPFCRCIRCKVGVLDRSALAKIPIVGECQKCHSLIDNVVPGEKCPKCKYKSGKVKK